MTPCEFHEKAAQCPWIKCTIEKCPFINSHVRACPFLSELHLPDNLPPITKRVDAATGLSIPDPANDDQCAHLYDS